MTRWFSEQKYYIFKKKDTHVFHMSKAFDKVMVDIVLISYSYGNNCNISLQLQKI